MLKNKKTKIIFILLIMFILTACGTDEAGSTEVSETISIIEGTYIVRAEDREKEVLENTNDVENTEPIEDKEEVTVENTDTIDESDSDEKENDEPVEEKTESEKQPEQSPAPVHTHAYSEAITANPTCTSNGVKTFTCSCGHSYTEVIAATGHHYNSSVTTNPTCTSNGVKTFTCSCGHSYTEAIAATGHSYSSSVTTEPSCFTAGVRTYTCGCGSSYTEAIAALGGHIGYNKDIISFATCNSEGLVEYCCVGCGDTYTEVLPIEDHNWGHKTISRNGIVIKVCDYCTYCGLEKECTGCQFSD